MAIYYFQQHPQGSGFPPGGVPPFQASGDGDAAAFAQALADLWQTTFFLVTGVGARTAITPGAATVAGAKLVGAS